MKKNIRNHIISALLLCGCAFALTTGAAAAAAENIMPDDLAAAQQDRGISGDLLSEETETHATKNEIRALIESIQISHPDTDDDDADAEDPESSGYECPSDLTFDYFGSAGSLIIPDVDISVALYKESVFINADKSDQDYVDDDYSAAYFTMGQAKIIADHVSQEFGKLYDCEVGTLAYLYNGTDLITLECTRMTFGTNEGSYIADDDGSNVAEDDVYVMYTCTGNSYNILLTFWQPVNTTSIA